MVTRTETDKAATAAASFNLMLLNIYYSGQDSDVAADLKCGLIENQTSGDAWDLIQTIAEDDTTLSASPAQLAALHPQECIALGEIFAQALLTGAGRQEDYYLANAVPGERKSAELSSAYKDLNAPTLARLFQPPRYS